MNIVRGRGRGRSELMKTRKRCASTLFRSKRRALEFAGRAGSAGNTGGFLLTASTRSWPWGALTAAVHVAAPLLRYHSSALRVGSSGNKYDSFAPVGTGLPLTRSAIRESSVWR